MFTVKATYRNETRRFTFPDTVLFPTYNELHHQLYRLLPISCNYYLSRLIFSPDASKPGRILVGKEVHSAEDYSSCVAPLRRLWPNPLLRFTIFDETSPQKASSVISERPSLYSAPTFPLPDVTSKSPSPVVSRHGCALPLSSLSFIPPPPPPFQPSPSCVHPPPFPPSPLPPPPLPSMIYTPTPNESHSLHECGMAGTAPYCSIARGKADITILLSSFKEELERILYRTFGTECVEQQSATLVKGSTSGVFGTNVVLPQTETPVSGSANASRWCFVCRTNFTGVWYGCVKCSWHAVCPSCFCKSHSAHTLSFGPSHVVQQRSTDCSPQVSTRAAGESKPPDDISGTSQSPGPASSCPVGESARSVHRGILCDRCHKTVVGVRHKCLDCPDYDLCTACMEFGAAEQHDPFHEFFDIESPGRVYVHTLFGPDRGRSPRNRQQVPSSDHAHITQHSSVTIPVDQPVRHSATCNLCDSAIIGERYKCITCPDFDTCSSCFRITVEQHPNHGFVRVNKPDDLLMRHSIRLHQTVHSALCNSCRKTIHGPRFKCMHPSCPDFDLCSDCEALPIPVHPLNHPMLKLRTSDTVVPTVCRAGQTRTIDEPSNQMPVLVCSKPPALLAPSPLVTPVKSLAPVPDIVCTSGHATNVPAEDQTPFAEFLSSLGTPVSDVPGEASTPFTTAPSRLAEVAERSDSPRSIRPPSEIYRQLLPRVNQEMMHLSAVQATKAEDLTMDNTVTGLAVHESLVAAAQLLETPTTSASGGERHGTCPVSPVASTKSIIDDYHTPSPVSSNVQELHRIARQLSADDQQESVTADPLQRNCLDSALIDDTNVPDGQIFPPGAEFVKGWHMVNNGGLPWPTTTEIQYVAGEMFAPEYSTVLRAKVGVTHPGQDFDIWTGDLKAPDVPGRYVGYWRLNDGQGNFFGSSVWIDLTVADHYSDQASEHALAASSMVMPSAHPTNSVNASDELQNVPHPSLPSTGTAMGEVEGPESDISSVSLVSVPSSDDEDAEWKDTRTHSPLEYVVLYDSNSEE